MDILDTQKNVLDFLRNSKNQNRLSHAYMFEGPKGVGKLETALYFVCMLWCDLDTPCLKCNICKQILNKQFLNLIYISTNKNLITVDEISKLQKEFSSTAALDGPRVYIIEDADKMSQDTQNKLLKFIEEPVSTQTYGILLTTKPDFIISTIKSRVISLKLNELSYNYLVTKLVELNVDDKYRNILPHIENSVEKCLELLNGSMQLNIIDLVYVFIDRLIKRDITFFYKDNQEFLSKNQNLVLFINLIQELYRDIYKVMIGQTPVTFVNVDFTTLMKLYKVSYIGEIIDELVELEHKLLYNGNINLNVVKMIMKLNGGVIS